MKKLLLIILAVFYATLLPAQDNSSKGKFSGLMFGDYYYNVARDTGIASLSNSINNGKKDLNGFQFRRIYFTYDYDISDNFTTRFRLEADQAANTSNGKIGVYVKDAYINWKNIFIGSNLIIGIQPTPAFEISEAFWGYRFLEKTIMDARGIVSSRDLAVSLKGKIDGDGMFKYWVMYGNGSGNSPETDKYKRYYAHIQFTPIKQFTATLYADLKARPSIPDPKSTSDPKETVSNNDLTYALFLGYQEKDWFTVGLEGFLNLRQNGFTKNSELKNQKGMGISAFASYNFMKELAAVVRYDYYDPNTDADSKGDMRNWFLFSLNYKLDDKFTISPNVVIETYEKIPNGRNIDASVTGRITFFYTF